MGTYYHLACRKCDRYLHFGKQLHQDDKDTLQGLYSETSHAWIRDTKAWEAVQSFLLEHVGHPLFFNDDEHDRSIDEYDEVDVDRLLQHES